MSSGEAPIQTSTLLSFPMQKLPHINHKLRGGELCPHNKAISSAAMNVGFNNPDIRMP